VPGAGRIWDLVVSADGSWVDTCGDDGYWFYSVQSEAWGGGSGLPSGRCSIAASPYSSGNENMIAVVGLSIYETENSGATWTRTRINPSSQGRIPFVATNRRSTAPMGTKFDLWFGDVSLYSVQCDKNAVGPSCGVDNTPAWEGPYTRTVGGHDDMGGILFDPSAANDACPILMSSDGGVYRNLEVTHPECQSPIWEQPSVSPHGLWLFAMDGADRLGATSEDLYFGNQDNGVFGATDAGAASPTWVNAECCDGFDTAADDAGAGSVIFSVCCGGDPSTSFLQAGAGFTGSREIDYPPVGQSPEWTYPDSIVNWGDNKYAMVTWGFRPETRGVFITENADESPIVWTELGDAPSGCAIYAGTADGVPTFYIQTGSCNADKTTDRVFKFTGTDPAGSWSEIVLPSGGFGIFTVSKSDPDLLLASGFTDTNAFMYKSTDGGASWISPPRLDSLMRGGGDFPIRNSRGPTDFTGMLGYHQPSLVAIDPTDPTLMIAGGRDSGIFFSTDGGSSWSLVTDPRDSHTSGIPHIPRPRFAYFDEEPGGAKDVYIGSQGRGIWRFKVSEGCVDDEYESLGSGNTDDSCWGASLGGLPATQTHLHCDEDWVYFQAEQGRTYEIETGNLVGGSDTTLSLAAGCGPEQVFDDNGGPGLASFLRWTADRSDFADLRIRQSADAYGAGKAYDITVREVCLTDLVLADMAVSAAVTFVADSTIATGPNFLVEATGSASLIAGNSVVFSSPTTVEGELTVNLAPSPCPSDPALLFESSVKEVERRKSRNGGGAGRGIWAF
jgi:hypothetical protein